MKEQNENERNYRDFVKHIGVDTVSRKRRREGNNKHHCYPKKDSRHGSEIKIINAEQHRRWHCLVRDMNPRQAVMYIAKNFMPEEMEKTLLTALRRS